jgi:hypothetical protein
MTQRSPLVIVNGRLSELAPGDSVEGASLGTVTASSGIVGGGDFNTGTKRVDLALAANPSGLVFTDNGALASDGASLVTAQQALASGLAGQAAAVVAVSGANEALAASQVALASGNAALADAVQSVAFSNSFTFTADSNFVPGDAVAINSAGRAQKITVVSGSTTLKSNLTTSVETGSLSYTRMRYSPQQKAGIVTYYRSATGKNEARPFYFNAAGIPIVGENTGTSTSGNPPVISGSYPVFLEYNKKTGVFHAFGADTTASYYPASRPLIVASGGTHIEMGAYYRSVSLGWASDFRQADTMYDGRYNVVHGLYINRILCDETTADYGQSTVGRRRYRGLFSNAYPSGRIDQQFVADTLGCAFHEQAGSGIVLYANQNRSYYLDSAVTCVLPNYDYNEYTHNVTLLSGQRISDSSNSPGGSTFNNLRPYYVIRGTYAPTINKVLFVCDNYNGTPSSRGTCFFADIVSGRAAQSGVVNSGVYGNWVQIDPAVVYNSGMYDAAVTWDEANQKFFMPYRSTSNYLQANIGTISGISSSGHILQISPPTILLSNSVADFSCEYIPHLGKNLISYYNSSNGQAELMLVNNLITNTYSATNSLSQTNFLGIAQTTSASGTSVEVLLPKATSTVHSNLTTGSFYYLEPASGTFTTKPYPAPSWSGSTNWQPIGKAISPSGLFLQNNL